MARVGTCAGGGALAAGLEVWMRSLSLVVLFFACGSPAAPAVEVVAAPAPGVEQAPVVKPEVVPEVAPVVAAVEVRLEAGCAEYLASYRQCIAEMGAEGATHAKVVEQQEASWKLAQVDPKVAGTLAEACSSARAASKLALPACKHW